MCATKGNIYLPSTSAIIVFKSTQIKVTFHHKITAYLLDKDVCRRANPGPSMFEIGTFQSCREGHELPLEIDYSADAGVDVDVLEDDWSHCENNGVGGRAALADSLWSWSGRIRGEWDNDTIAYLPLDRS